MSILIRDVLLDGRESHVYIEGNLISEIGKKVEADIVIDGRRKAAVPGLINTHTHAAMTLFRGFADDVSLHDWLQSRIWPVEAKIRPEDVYWGTKLACLEMIKTGTTTFNDMYFHMDHAAKAVKEAGLRAFLSEGFIDLLDPSGGEEEFKKNTEILHRIENMRIDRIRPSLGPHALYTVSPESLRMIRNYADARNWPIHFHLSETEAEVSDCVAEHGKRPVSYLESIGFLCDKLICAHAVWLDGDEIKTLAKVGARISHNPVSNMKLAVGAAMPYQAMKDAGLRISLGTDGCASNNNLDLFQTMKVAALLQKHANNSPTILSAPEAFHLATKGGAEVLGINAGEIAEGRLADLVLVDLEKPELTPLHDITANLVYAASGDCVDTVICDGKVLMRGRKVEGENAILKRASEVARDLVTRE